MLAEHEIVGTWRMTSWTTRSMRDGSIVTYPLGESPTGYITYTSAGRMAVTAQAAARQAIGGGILVYAEWLSNPESKAQALETYLSYAGAYTIDGDRVTHHIEVSWWPDLTGTDIVRIFAIEGTRLRLSSPPFVAQGIEQHHLLEWERV